MQKKMIILNESVSSKVIKIWEFECVKEFLENQDSFDDRALEIIFRMQAHFVNKEFVRKTNLILNKLSVTKFEKLSDEFMSFGLESEALMQRAVEMIILNAQMEERFCSMYANLCRKITDKWSAPGETKPLNSHLIS